MRRVRALAPDFLVTCLRTWRDRRELKRTPGLDGDVTSLRSQADLDVHALLTSPESDTLWVGAQRVLAEVAITNGAGSVNPGDQRALFYLVSGLAPSAVLEIGTHIGASTLHIALAMTMRPGSEGGKAGKLVTIDIEDVNDPVSRPWLDHGADLSPAELLRKVGVDDCVEFRTGSSLDYLAGRERKFDLVFLDGDHAAVAVYREIVAALCLLNPGGVILLHDYFTGARPLWETGAVIPGPVLAVDRLRSEGIDLAVIPLGELPWPTKHGSNTTSLAVLLRGSP